MIGERLVFCCLLDDLCDFKPCFIALGAWPQYKDVSQLLGHMKVCIDSSSFHLIVGFDDIGVKNLPSASVEVGWWQSLHVATKW